MFANPWLKKPVYVNRGISYGDYSDGVFASFVVVDGVGNHCSRMVV